MVYIFQDSGLYTCKARNEMNIKGDSVDAIIYLNSERGNIWCWKVLEFVNTKKWRLLTTFFKLGLWIKNNPQTEDFDEFKGENTQSRDTFSQNQ